MSHDPEAGAAAYLGGVMSDRQRQAFEAHLLSCEACWEEVGLAERGRQLAHRGRELAPPRLQDALRALLASECPAPSRQGRRLTKRARIGLSLALSALLVVGATLGAVITSVATAPSQPAPIEAAVARFQAQQLPGPGVPDHEGPSLRAAGLALVGGASGTVGGSSVTAFVYKDRAGRRVLLYERDAPFPKAADATMAQLVAGSGLGWSATVDGLHLECLPGGKTLVLAQSQGLAQAAATALARG